ncbi:MAG: hypothetical protein K2Y23_02075 [Cyanobacteria bacterium]|nr:hypothetical protein [Cyanobacteriota bacterium]
MIEHLPPLTPDATRNARTLARCHDTLDRRRATARAAARYAVERNALLGFGAIYLSSLAFNVMRVFFS